MTGASLGTRLVTHKKDCVHVCSQIVFDSKTKACDSKRQLQTEEMSNSVSECTERTCNKRLSEIDEETRPLLNADVYFNTLKRSALTMSMKSMPLEDIP